MAASRTARTASLVALTLAAEAGGALAQAARGPLMLDDAAADANHGGELARPSGISREALARFVASAQRFGSLGPSGVVRALRDPRVMPYVPVSAHRVRHGPISSGAAAGARASRRIPVRGCRDSAAYIWFRTCVGQGYGASRPSSIGAGTAAESG